MIMNLGAIITMNELEPKGTKAGQRSTLKDSHLTATTSALIIAKPHACTVLHHIISSVSSLMSQVLHTLQIVVLPNNNSNK